MNPHHSPEQSLSAQSAEQSQGRGVNKRAEQEGDISPQRAPSQGSAHGHTAGRDQAGRGAGLPVPAPQAERPPTSAPLTAKDASVKSRIRLPHERDQDAAMTADGVDPSMAQAAQDLAHGLKDTSRAAETDQTYHRLHESAQRERQSLGQCCESKPIAGQDFSSADP